MPCLVQQDSEVLMPVGEAGTDLPEETETDPKEKQRREGLESRDDRGAPSSMSLHKSSVLCSLRLNWRSSKGQSRTM